MTLFAQRSVGSLGGTLSTATAINSSGQVTGYSRLAGDASAHAFIYANGVLKDLGGLGGSFSVGYGINSSRQIAGYSYLTGDTTSHAFVYSNGTMTDLNDLVSPGSGWILNQAYGINDAGQITGTGTFKGHDEAFLLTPVAAPEPSGVVLFVLGTSGLAWWVIRRA